MATKKVVKSKSSDGILGRAKKLSEIAQVITALFYGRSGSGKTTLAGTFPEPILVLDIGERGTDSLNQSQDIESLAIHTWQELEEVFWELKSGSRFKSVIIDAAHTMQGLSINEAREIANKKPTDQTSQRDMGQATRLMIEWLYNYRDLRDDGYNVVFLAHDRLRETETDEELDGIAPEIGPNLMPGVAKALLGMVNVVGNTYIVETAIGKKTPGKKQEKQMEYRLRLGPNPYYHTKIRSPKENAVPEFIVDPDFDKLVSAINGGTSTTKRRVIIRK